MVPLHMDFFSLALLQISAGGLRDDYCSIQTVRCQQLHSVWSGGDLYQIVPYFKDLK